MWQSGESEMTFDFRRTPTARFYSRLPGHHTSTSGCLWGEMCPGETSAHKVFLKLQRENRRPITLLLIDSFPFIRVSHR